MKILKYVIYILMVFILTCCYSGKYSSDSKINTFRNTKWGMTIEQVLSAESGLTFKNKDSSEGKIVISSAAELINLPVELKYEFYDSLLVSASYIVVEDIMANEGKADQWILEFSKLRILLTEKYGRPTDVHFDESFGLIMTTTWLRQYSEIYLSLSDVFGTFFYLKYTSRQYEYLKEEYEEKEKNKRDKEYEKRNKVEKEKL